MSRPQDPLGRADGAPAHARRGPRRATGGTPRRATPQGAEPSDGVQHSDGSVPAAGAVLAAEAAAPGVTSSGPERAPDDTDLGWGEPVGDDDERFLREVPPHW